MDHVRQPLRNPHRVAVATAAAAPSPSSPALLPPAAPAPSTSSTSTDGMDFDATLAFLDELDEELPALPLTLAAVAPTLAPTNPSTGTVTTAPPPPSVAPPPSGDVADRGVDAERLLEELLLSDDDTPSTIAADTAGRTPPSADDANREPPMEPPAPTKARPKMTSRMRQRAEMEYLRAQVEELEAELQQLKQGSNGSGGDGDNDNGESAGREVLNAHVWERIALNQLAAKQRAEVENLKLRGLLEGQLRVAKSLEKLLRKRSLTGDDDLILANKRPRNTEDPWHQSVKPLHLHQQLAEIAQVMDECGLSKTWKFTEDSQVLIDRNNAIFLEITYCRSWPFAFKAVGEAVWKCFNSTHIDFGNGYFGAAERSEHECNLQFEVRVGLRRAETTIRCTGMGTRRVERDRMVVVYQSAGRAQGNVTTPEGVRILEKAYCTVEPVPGTPSSTVSKACIRMWPEISEEDEERVQVGVLVDLIIGSFNQNIQVMYQQVENFLVDAAMTR